MKIYVKNGQVFFDFAEVDIKDNSCDKSMQCKNFLRETSDWEFTKQHNLMRLGFAPSAYSSCGELSSYLTVLNNIQAVANSYLCQIEITNEFKEFVRQKEQELEEQIAIVRAKKEAQAKKDKWERLCKYGCGNCEHKKRWNDDHICDLSGDVLKEENHPCDFGRIHYLFNYVAMPTEKCPYKVI